MSSETKKDLKYLKKIISPRAYRALTQNGAALNIWRNSSPHNIWVEGKSGTVFWHSQGWMVFPLKLFKLVWDNEERVVQYFGSDSGMPVHSKYVLKKLK